MTTKISVAGLGYVGLSMAVLLARHNTVVGLDLDAPRVDRLRRGESPIHDDDISRFLAEEDLDLTFTTEAEEAHTRRGLRDHRDADQLRPGDELLRHPLDRVGDA